MTRSPPTDLQRFWDKVEKGPECWLWVGKKHLGYGRFLNQGKWYMAHRWIWEQYEDKLTNAQLIHTCPNKACVNPDHLVVKKNPSASKTPELPPSSPPILECPRGHILDAANRLHVGGEDLCRICLKIQEKHDRAQIRREIGMK